MDYGVIIDKGNCSGSRDAGNFMRIQAIKLMQNVRNC